ncbi:MAG TPA: sigma-70 family RNA polymerase sigma factor [Lacunisphaera sp.]|nr:sigma-70 family RNA polymerase sigma factor [Lacunisphaera sp.]
MSTPDQEIPAANGQTGSFPITQWSLVVHAGAADTRAHAAMEKLCRQYWYPLYAFVRRQGRDHHAAEDCVQEFLARLLAADGISRARREQGRFRTFLLTALRNFLINDWQRGQAAKRGGGRPVMSLDGQDASQRFALEPVDAALSPDQAFDRSWAQGVIAGAIEQLRVEYETGGRGRLFVTLAPLVWGQPPADAHAELAAQLGLKDQAFNVALHRLRRRLGERLRATVAETVADSADVDAEVRHLIAAVGGASGA